MSDLVETARALEKVRAKLAASQRPTARQVDLSLLAEERRLTAQLQLLARGNRPIQIDWVAANYGFAGWVGYKGREFAVTANITQDGDQWVATLSRPDGACGSFHLLQQADGSTVFGFRVTGSSEQEVKDKADTALWIMQASWLRTYLNIPPCLEIVQSPNPTDEEIARVKVTMKQLRDMGDWHCPLLIVRAAGKCSSPSLLRALLVELDPCCDPQAWLGLYGRLRAHMPTGGAMDGSEAWLRRLRRDCYAIPLTRAFLESVPDRVAESEAAEVPPESIRLFEEFYPSVLERDDYRAEPTIDMMGGLACGLLSVPLNKYGRMTLWFGADGVSLTAIDRDTLHVDHHHVVRDIAHLNSLLDDLIG